VMEMVMEDKKKENGIVEMGMGINFEFM